MLVTLPGSRQASSWLASGRRLVRFWVTVLVLLGIGGGVLQMLGPPKPAQIATAVHADRPAATGHPPEVKLWEAQSAAPLPTSPGRDTPGPIADPDPTMLEPYPGSPNLYLPRIADDGRMPMATYAAGFDPSSLRPRLGILIAGIGMNETDSLAAIKNLPSGVTLAISPYATDIARVLALARMTGHEYLLSILMEPQGYPVYDPDDRYALMTSLPPLENLGRLRGMLARIPGYVGVTNVQGPMRGERFADVADQFDPILEEVGHRGLLFLDARTARPLLAHAWSRSADLVLDDDPIDLAVLDQRLDVLTHVALDKGSALGIVSVPRPVTLERVAAWANTLLSKGVALAPVSALVLPPAKQDAEK